jgi:glycosyltransferase involved in cell wall biosynthesis
MMAEEPGVTRTMSALELSVIVPCFNEEENVTLLYAELMGVLPGLGCDFEVLFVDDGSTDGTFARLAALVSCNACVRVVKLRRNYGQTAAMAAGIDHARGRILVTMDADLQNDPADIPRLLVKIEEGYDLVVGYRQNRQDKLLSRRLPSVIANRLIARVTGIAIRDNGCTLKAFRADFIKRQALYAEMHRFIPAVASIAGCRLTELPVHHRARRFGTSKYGLSRIWRVTFDLIVIRTLLSSARRPLASFLGSAGLVGLLSLASTGAAIWSTLGTGYAPVVVFTSIAILFGSLALFLGLIGMMASLSFQYLSEPDLPRGS